jgi:ceroid-lipofuscinosis MFS transporter 7
MAIDQWGWSEEDTLLYLGIILASGGVLSGFCFGSIGPLSKRFDERLLLIFGGIAPMILARLLMMPMGSDEIPFVGNYTECGYEGDK